MYYYLSIARFFRVQDSENCIFVFADFVRCTESFFPAELFLAHGFEKHNNVNVFEIREN